MERWYFSKTLPPFMKKITKNTYTIKKKSFFFNISKTSTIFLRAENFSLKKVGPHFGMIFFLIILLKNLKKRDLKKYQKISSIFLRLENFS